MTTLDAVFLGVIQGFTEFLPISSSGHLVLLQSVLGIRTEDISLEIAVHLGTLLSILVVFRHDLWMMIRGFFRIIISGGREKDIYGRLAIMIIVGTVPAVIVGGLFKDSLEGLFKEPGLVGITLIVTAVILWLTRYSRESYVEVSWGKALIIGMAQAMAIIPGISRSGSTISAGLYLGMNRTEAAHFSFFLAIPAILGAALLQIGDFLETGVSQTQLISLGSGALAAFITGYLAIIALMKVLRSNRFHLFAPYCLIVGIITLLVV